jgi:glycosyltransferase involved in cell wall biosynthesis
LSSSDRPIVSALMAARDAGPVIEDAIRSVLAQTMDALELLVVDDGSVDATAEIVRSFDDPRVILLATSGVGRGAARNLALRQARGSFLAITDADDVSEPNRLGVQVARMQAEPDLAVLGAQVLDFGPWGGPTPGYLTPTDRHAVAARFARGQMAIAHQACLMRLDAVQRAGGYSSECVRCQDLELFLRLQPAPMVNLPDVLVRYRTASRHPRWAYWRENARYRRYAVARAERVAAGLRPPTYDEFAASSFWCSPAGTAVERLRHLGDSSRRRLRPQGVSL